MAEKVRFAIVGYGHIGKRHADMISKNPHCELVAACDIKSELGEHARENYQIPFYTDINAMLDSDTAMDVVCICTPNGLHANHAIAALDRHHDVVCEKPMGLTKAECEEVIHRALNVHKHVFCVMQNRYSPASVWLKQMVNEQRLGEIHLVHINCYWNRDDRYYAKSDWKGTLELDGGPLFTQFSHFIDIMYWLFGDITAVEARFMNFTHRENTEFEDSGLVNFKFKKGGLGSINYSTAIWDKNLESSITIVGSKGSIKVGGQYMEKVEVCHIEDYEMPELPPANPPNDYGQYKGSAANHGFVIENVVDTLNGNSTNTTNALEGLKVVEIIESIYEYRSDFISAGAAHVTHAS